MYIVCILESKAFSIPFKLYHFLWHKRIDIRWIFSYINIMQYAKREAKKSDGRKKATTIFSALYFSISFFFSLTFRWSKQRGLYWKLYAVVGDDEDDDVVTFVHWPIRCLPNRILFFSSTNHPVSFSPFFFQFPLCHRQFMLIFSSYVLVFMKEEDKKKPTQTHTQRLEWMCAKTTQTEKIKTRVELYLPISNSTAHIRSAQSSIVARCKRWFPVYILWDAIFDEYRLMFGFGFDFVLICLYVLGVFVRVHKKICPWNLHNLTFYLFTFLRLF